MPAMAPPAAVTLSPQVAGVYLLGFPATPDPQVRRIRRMKKIGEHAAMFGNTNGTCRCRKARSASNVSETFSARDNPNCRLMRPSPLIRLDAWTWWYQYFLNSSRIEARQVRGSGTQGQEAERNRRTRGRDSNEMCSCIKVLVCFT